MFFKREKKESFREHKKYYIGATKKEQALMLEELELDSLEDLYKHIHSSARIFPSQREDELLKRLSYESLKKNLEVLAKKNVLKTSFMGEGLLAFSLPKALVKIANIRGLSTSYTAYQAERSQGTLVSHWIYQCLISSLTGFEAINASLYDRSTALVEAILCAKRCLKDETKKTVLVLESIYLEDKEVLETYFEDSHINLLFLPFTKEERGTFKPARVKQILSTREDIFALVYPQVNSLGYLEDVDELTDLAHKWDVNAISVVDVALLGKGALKPPSDFGKKGSDFVVGEGQHLAILPNFGGPGLGILGVRMNNVQPNPIRFTPGKYVGKTKDSRGQEAYVLVLSTREQHIRREKATSNICSNQGFVATLVGASLLLKGEKRFSFSSLQARKNALWVFESLSQYENILPFESERAFFNEWILEVQGCKNNLFEEASKENIWLGVDVTDRLWFDEEPKEPKIFIKMSFSDTHTKADLKRLVDFFKKRFDTKK